MNRLFCSALFIPAVIAGFAHASEKTDRPAIQVVPNNILIDDRVRISASGLQPGQTAVIRAFMKDHEDRDWRSHAAFVADTQGRIDVTQQAPTEGTYVSADPMGLFWSMQLASDIPADQRAKTAFVPREKEPLITALALEVDGTIVATAELKRVLMDPSVIVKPVKEEGMVGVLCLPPSPGPHPGLLVLSGSDGGIKKADAGLLASRGLAAFALAYFREEGLPDQLVEISLDDLKKGIDWMGRQKEIDPKRLGVIGGSKGGELSLLLASNFPELRAVVAYVPSNVVWQGISWTGPPPDKSSWSLQGQPIPYLRGKPGMEFMSQWTSGKPVRLTTLYGPALEDQEAVEKATIAVEKIKGSVLLISGGDDQMWPSAKMSDLVMERLKRHDHSFPFEHLKYEKAGHAIRKTYLPSAGTTVAGVMALGGTEEANAKAQADSWPKVIHFLKRSLE